HVECVPGDDQRRAAEGRHRPCARVAARGTITPTNSWADCDGQPENASAGILGCSIPGSRPSRIRSSTPTMPLTCFSIPSVFSCAVELALTVEYGLPVQELPDGRQVPCWDAFHESRKFVVALARLTQVLAPSGYSDPTSLRRAIELANHRPPVRKALRTLVSAITALGEHGKAKEHGRNFLSDGARRLWELMDNADRDAVADLLPLVRELWGWPDTVSSGSKAPQPGPAPECSIRLVGEVWHLRYFAETGNYPATGNKCLRW